MKRILVLLAVFLFGAMGAAAYQHRADYFAPSERGEGAGAGPFTSVAFSPDGKTVAKFRSARLTLWVTATGKQQGNFQYTRPITSWAFSPDSKTLAVGFSDNVVKVLDVATAKEQVALEGEGK